MPASSSSIYLHSKLCNFAGRIKRVCETELGIVSQCLKPGRKLLSLDRQFLENVSLKINVKVSFVCGHCT